MKTFSRIASLISTFLFTLAAAAQFAGLVSISGVTPIGLAGGAIISCLLAFTSGDYTRKPAFRVRRTAGDSTHDRPTVNRPAGPGPDWTYTTRAN